MDDDALMTSISRNDTRLDTIMSMTEKQQTQIDEVVKGLASLTASFKAYKDDITWAKEVRTLFREHQIKAEKELQELRDLIAENSRRVSVLEDGARQCTRDSEEGDSAVRTEMNKGFNELRKDIANLHSDIAEIKAQAGNSALKAWKWVGGLIGAAAMGSVITAVAQYISR